MQKIYERINWQNEPSTNTAINDDNLNKMDYAIYALDDRVVELYGYEERAKQSEKNAKLSEEHVSVSEAVAENNAILSQSYATGGTGTRENEDVDNAKYYYEQATRVAQGLSGALLPGGTITFEELEASTSIVGYMYNISNEFVTDERFIHSGISYGAGTNIYLTIDGLWDVLAGSNVVSVNGKTGVVILKSSDVLCDDGGSIQENIDSIKSDLTNIDDSVREFNKNFNTIYGWRWRRDIVSGTYIDLDFTGWSGRRFLIATRAGLYCITVWSGSVSGATFVAGNDVNFEYPGGFVVRIHNTLGSTNYVSIH